MNIFLQLTPRRSIASRNNWATSLPTTCEAVKPLVQVNSMAYKQTSTMNL